MSEYFLCVFRQITWHTDLFAFMYQAWLTGLARFPISCSLPFPLSKFRCVHMRMRASPVTEISNGMKIFTYEHFRPVTGTKHFDKLALLSQQGRQNGIILPHMYFHFKSIRINFISKVTRVDKAMIVAMDTSLCDAIILIWFLELHPGHRADISRMKRGQNSSRLPNQPGDRAYMKRPLKVLSTCDQASETCPLQKRESESFQCRQG